ncbi:MAG: glycosyltransferase family protein [Proteobacteria bacterium]|nr:glycosyltransferase family protein [Pseudomonadota bacterium]
MSTVAIIQARMGSSRLPGKVLEVFAGKTALDHCVERTRACPAIDDVVIATTTAPGDDVLVDACRARGWRWFRGAEHDVLDRYYQAARDVGAAHVVRITSDCPLTDPAVIAALIACYRADDGIDYASTSHPAPTFPLGISAEIVRFDALARAWREDQNPAWREHVTPYIYRNPASFRIVGIGCDADYTHHRWTLDTPADAALIRHLLDALDGRTFGWRDTLAVVDAHPGWQAINADIVQRPAPR